MIHMHVIINAIEARYDGCDRQRRASHDGGGGRWCVRRKGGPRSALEAVREVAAIDTFAEVGAEDAHLEALAVALEALALSAVAALVVLVASAPPLQLRLERQRVPLQDRLHRLLLLARVLPVVVAVPAVAVRPAFLVTPETLAVQLQALGVLAVATALLHVFGTRFHIHIHIRAAVVRHHVIRRHVHRYRPIRGDAAILAFLVAVR